MNRTGGNSRLRVAELYCGIGGCAAAVHREAVIVSAVDINRRALEIYRRNFPHPTAAVAIESLSASTLRDWDADLWWISPPCQPFTRRGLRRDHRDSRTQSFLEILSLLKEVTPRFLAIENVPGFRGSITHSLLLDTLDRLSFTVQERVLCPTAFGIPNRRERYYLLAGRTPLRDLPPPRVEAHSLRSFLDREPPPGLRVDPDLVSRYRHALSIVDPLDSMAVASCFTAAYGHSPIRSGSYLKTPSGLRRFSPTEILRLLGFPKSYTLPSDLPIEIAWRLVGNSLSLHPVRYVLSAIPELSRLVRTEVRATTT
jgi:DNA (cytosine-5)-methyltransferase 1